MFSLSSRSIDRMAGVNPRLQLIAKAAIKITVVDFGIPEYGGLRTVEDQRKLFSIGVSNADGVTKLSNHQSGQALDFYAIDPETGKASWEPELLATVAAAFLQASADLGHALKWGGLWRNFKDMPHMEL